MPVPLERCDSMGDYHSPIYSIYTDSEGQSSKRAQNEQQEDIASAIPSIFSEVLQAITSNPGLYKPLELTQSGQDMLEDDESSQPNPKEPDAQDTQVVEDEPEPTADDTEKGLEKIERFIIDFLKKLNYAADEANWPVGFKRGDMQIILPMGDSVHPVQSRGLQFPRGIEGGTSRLAQFLQVMDLSHLAILEKTPILIRDVYYHNIPLFIKQVRVEEGKGNPDLATRALCSKLASNQGYNFFVWTDNTTTENILHSRKSKDFHSNNKWKEIQKLLIREDVDITPLRVTSKDNSSDRWLRGVHKPHVAENRVWFNIPNGLSPFMFHA
ncbi:endodeoxyribonuclease [Puccinia graminis f. sp. tritici]|uniref:Endodeoxyribonuclease n=1 Tax=Puccinia graminis f. sp. tritici TaxID=56615 RepID=A0A5B0S0B9_PUCGR|nr:endodeoxyribonuclease [Puccinia graminis f. sp. tritici]